MTSLFSLKIPKFLNRVKSAIKLSRIKLNSDSSGVFVGTTAENVFEELETQLLLADVGVDTTMWLLNEVKQEAAANRGQKINVATLLEGKVRDLLVKIEAPLVIDQAHQPYVILVVGVNGVGKTTTIGKLTSNLLECGHSVLLAASDTFRAGAVEQLTEWANRTESNIISQAPNADPAAVIFDALSAARARDIDVVIADTAGRLHTTTSLMDQLKKMCRVISRVDPSAPHEIMLVLDATQGQNALTQAKVFQEAIGITSLVITKLDGTAKGGILLSIARELSLPVRFLATGENISDLHAFEAQAFANALFAET